MHEMPKELYQGGPIKKEEKQGSALWRITVEAIKDKNDLYVSVTPCTLEYNRSYLENYSKTQQTAHTHLIHLVTSNTSCSLPVKYCLNMLFTWLETFVQIVKQKKRRQKLHS